MLKYPIRMVLVSAAILASAMSANAQYAARANAIHECAVMAQRYPQTTFSALEYELYRACMAQRGQVE